MFAKFLDGVTIRSTLSGDPDLHEIVEMFVDEMPGRVDALARALRAGEQDNLRLLVHQLKGAAGSYGFGPVSRCAAEVEDSLRDGVAEDQIRRGVEDLMEMCRRARA